MTIQTSDNKFGIVEWIVDPVPGLGTHTTIAAAVATASAGDTIYVRGGVYTEDITLKALTLTTLASNVFIVGKISYSAAGQATIRNITLQTNGDFAVEVTGAAGSVLGFYGCNIEGNDFTAISYTATGGQLIFDSSIVRAQAGFSPLIAIGTGTINSRNCGYADVDQTIDIQGMSFNSTYDSFNSTVSISGGAIIRPEYCIFETGSTGRTNLILNSVGITHFCEWCRFSSGTVPCITVTSGFLSLSYAFIGSSNLTPITGAGTVNYGPLTFTGPTGIVPTNSPRNILPAPGSWVLLGNLTASNSANISFTSNITTTYRNYAIILSSVVPVTNAVSLRLRVSTDGGATYLAAGYSSNAIMNSGAGVASSTSTTELLLTRAATQLLNNTADNGLSGVIYLHDLTVGVAPKISGEVNYLETSGGVLTMVNPSGRGPAALTGDALQFTMSSGNISTGNFKLYGIA